MRENKSPGHATWILLKTPNFDVYLIQLWYLGWALWVELQWGWGLDKCQLADPLPDEDWGKQLEDLAEIISASLIESVHLPLAVQICNSGLSKFTPAPFSRLVKSCWQDCVLLSVHLFLFPNVGCQGSAWDCLELQRVWMWRESLARPATCSDTLN